MARLESVQRKFTRVDAAFPVLINPFLHILSDVAFLDYSPSKIDIPTSLQVSSQLSFEMNLSSHPSYPPLLSMRPLVAFMIYLPYPSHPARPATVRTILFSELYRLSTTFINYLTLMTQCLDSVHVFVIFLHSSPCNLYPSSLFPLVN